MASFVIGVSRTDGLATVVRPSFDKSFRSFSLVSINAELAIGYFSLFAKNLETKLIKEKLTS